VLAFLATLSGRGGRVGRRRREENSRRHGLHYDEAGEKAQLLMKREEGGE
jgi:hypothetical protein